MTRTIDERIATAHRKLLLITAAASLTRSPRQKNVATMA